MSAVLVFAVTLEVAVLVSGLAQRSVLSTAVLFLVAGIGAGVLGYVPEQPGHPIVSFVAEIALFSVLFTDGMRTKADDLLGAWRLPGRALLLGLPLTVLIAATLAHFVAGLPWPESFLLAAALSPTDPVLASAVVGREEIPNRLRHLLNVESGLNDGLALPIVLVLLASLGASTPGSLLLLSELAGGVAVGILVPLAVIRVERASVFPASPVYEPLSAFAIGVIVFALSSLTHANEFLAAFSAGITIASVSPDTREAFHRFGELVTELMKLAALFVFGAMISPQFLATIPFQGYVFGGLMLFVVRPLAFGVALFGSRITRGEWLAAAWFGPKGFASVVFALLILKEGIQGADQIFHLAGLVIVASIVLHSSTDVLVAQWFRGQKPEPTG